MTESPIQYAGRMKEACFTDATTMLSLTKLAGLDESAAAGTLDDFFATLADKVTKIDILAHLYLCVKRRDHTLELLQPKLRAEDAPASAFTAQRQLLKDQEDALNNLHERRKEMDRDRCIPAELAKVKEEHARNEAETGWAYAGLLRDKGYYYVPGVDAPQPESCLDPEVVAMRDVVRMRHLPKSPHEDRVLAEEYEATFACEVDVDPAKLPKDPLPNDEFGVPPTAQRGPFMNGRYNHHDRLATRLMAERTWAWNATYARAEAKMEAIDRKRGRPWICACCQEKNTQPLTDGWQDEPANTVDSPWIGKFTTVIVKTLLWGVILGWLLSNLIVGQPAWGKVWCATALQSCEECATDLPSFGVDAEAETPANPCGLAGADGSTPGPLLTCDDAGHAAGVPAYRDPCHGSNGVPCPRHDAVGIRPGPRPPHHAITQPDGPFSWPGPDAVRHAQRALRDPDPLFSSVFSTLPH